MNHMSYRLSLIRHDELLQEAAARRRANEVAVAAEASARTPSRRELLKLRPLRLHRSAS